MNKELITLFFSMEHESNELIEVFNKEQLLDFYISGCELRLRMERRFEDFNKFHKETGITLGDLLINKYNVAKQLHEEFINSDEFIKYLKELDEYSEKYVSL